MNNVKEKIEILKKSSRDYPKILKEIHNAPKQLYVRGNLPKEYNLNFAIVGTRAASDYGRTLAFKIAKESNMTTQQMGALLNQLKIKITSCQLGCF